MLIKMRGIIDRADRSLALREYAIAQRDLRHLSQSDHRFMEDVFLDCCPDKPILVQIEGREEH
jgi:hypothetical protein